MNLQGLKNDIDDTWSVVSNWCDAGVESAKVELEQSWRNLQKAGIRDAVAPLHMALAQNARNRYDGNIHMQIDGFHNDWNTYAEDVDTSAKGKWATSARKEIAERADKLKAIEP